MSKLPLVNESVLSSIPAAKRHIHNMTKELHFPFILYSILVGLYFTFRLNYAWLFFNGQSALNKSVGTKIFVYLIGVGIAVIIFIPIMIKSLRIMHAMRIIVRFSEQAKKPLQHFIQATIVGLILQIAFPIVGIYFSFVPKDGELIALAALAGLISTLILLYAFIMLNKGLIILRDLGLYGSDRIK